MGTCGAAPIGIPSRPFLLPLNLQDEEKKKSDRGRAAVGSGRRSSRAKCQSDLSEGERGREERERERVDSRAAGGGDLCVH